MSTQRMFSWRKMRMNVWIPHLLILSYEKVLENGLKEVYFLQVEG